MASDSPPSPAVAGLNPTIHAPSWCSHIHDPTAQMYSSSSYPISGFSVTSPNIVTLSRRYLPSNNEGSDPDPDTPVDAYSSDHFRMFEFKVRRCARGRSHDWTDCPFAHPGENARRRDPRKFHYSGSACPDFRKVHCKKGDSCEFAHGIYECYLHPERYRTQPCKDGTSCKRRVCFFAHTPEQLRVLPQQSPRGSNSVNSSMESYDGSPMRQAMELAKGMPFLSASPEISPENSPPMSPICRSMSRLLRSSSVSEMVASLRKVKSLPTSWNVQDGSVGSVGSPGFVSPRGSMLRPGFCSLPSTPTRIPTCSTAGVLDFCDEGGTPVIQTGNVEGSRIRSMLAGIHRVLAGIGLVSPISMGDTLVIQTGDVETGHLLTGSRFGVGRSDITPMNDDFRMYIANAEPQTGNYPLPLEISGDNSHLVRPLEQHLRSNCFVKLFVTSEILGMVFEIIYQESHIMAYFFIWFVCAMIAMYVARLLAMIEGGMANREQFAVYLRCFSFLLLELLQYWGIHQGNYITALKIILRVTGAIIGWWVVGVLQSYMDAFGMHLPLRRRDD